MKPHRETCHGKRQLTKAEAKRLSSKVQQKSALGAGMTLMFYRCTHCGFFHFGNRKKKSS